MDWTTVTLVCIINLGTAIFVYGKLTERVSNQGEKLHDLQDRVEGHDKRLRIVEMGEALASLAQLVKETHGRG